MYQLNLPDEPATKVARNIAEALLPEWWAKFIQKNTAYGDKLATGDDLGIKAFIPEMNRKMQGIKNMVWHEQPQGEGEGAREKAMDLIGHLFIFVHNLDQADATPAAAQPDSQEKARSALGWPKPETLSYDQLQAKGHELIRANEHGEICPQDSGHYLASHEPGGMWFGKGHDGKPSPWPPPRPAVMVDPMTGDLQPHPLIRSQWGRNAQGIVKIPVAGFPGFIDVANPIPCPEWCSEKGKWGAGTPVSGHYWAQMGSRGFVAHTPEYHATLRDPNDPQGEYYEEPGG